ncbi:MAG: YidC/Oxa1 family insertase periplasmic-domain containing protein, partial [Candidatus Saccharimonadales bacterium]
VHTVNGHAVVEYLGVVDDHAISVSYTSPASDSARYLVHVIVSVKSAGPHSSLAVALPSTLASMETDTADDIRHLAYGYGTASGDVKSLPFSKLDSGVMLPISGPLDWVALRNKYFLIAVIPQDSAITRAQFTGAARIQKLVPDASASVWVPFTNGQARFDLYMGPQEFERLRSLGHGLDQVNPYAGWFHSVVQPFATIVTRVLLWMKRSTGLGYGWVIIIFGIVVRLLLWPLNQSAMRTSIRMQRIQPELAEVQKKYKSDPKKQQEALVKLYQAHGMTPFSPMMGCLPMMLPMPILFALYFVFLNTIEFRGVSVLWMHDIYADYPFFITRLVMWL